MASKITTAGRKAGGQTTSAPDHLVDDGLLLVEIGEAERALRRALPTLPLLWVEFAVGGMGVFAVTREQLLSQQTAIQSECNRRGLI